ncbi:mechanosensitive ion channel family protein [Gloeobacter kilaueensis]|uniref:Uncharacterized protein n=1 Tax=Gloeobacter kilaueensis (strain ATCC BAA-2537 / CCAP 1431/1 / ULC 316 / JS1) TaxID=1183438 RepID=U5QI98_GLOK1|nr:hypothetical protein [Gloeobacter kilaueensis]AGY58717.1 hypothetical protein GKIL_2471 [Gloeobacter kilaueensis JS1]
METGGWPVVLQRFQQSIVDLLFRYLPNLIAALLIFLVGWFIAALLSRIVRSILQRVNFQKLLGENFGFQLFENTNLRIDAARLSGQVTYWFLFVTSILLAADAANLPQVEQFIAGLFTYIPQVFSALAIVLLAVVFGTLLRRIIAASLPAAYGYVATALQALIYGLALLAALAELGISRVVIYILIGGIVGLVMISGGIAFGLGGKEAAREIIEQLRKPREP